MSAGVRWSQDAGLWGFGVSSSPLTHGQGEARLREPSGALDALGMAFPLGRRDALISRGAARVECRWEC